MSDLKAIADKLHDFEKDVLRTACGDDRMTGWGAATTEAVEALQEAGLLVQRRKMSGYSYEPTDLGRKVARLLQKEQA